MAARNRILESRNKTLETLSASKLGTNSATYRIQNGADQTTGESDNTHDQQSNAHLSSKEAKDQPRVGKTAAPTFCQQYFSWRCAIVLLLHTSAITNVIPRHSFPIALVCMVNRQNTMGNVSGLNTTYNNSSSIETTRYEFDWDSEIQGLLLTGMQFVSFLGPIVSNVIKNMIGSKLSLSAFSLIIVVLSMLSPIAARTSPYALLAIRITSGICSGTTPPLFGDALAWWSPDSEKLTWVTLAFSGFNVAGIVSSLLSGYMCTVKLDNGWPFIFYFTGIANVIWLVAWQFLYVDKPENHPYISEQEKAYILANRSGVASSSKKKLKDPYKKILTSVPVLAYIFTCSCHVWAMIVSQTYLPLYINGVLQFSAEQVGILFSGFTLARIIGAFLWTVVGNLMMTRSTMTKSTTRKTCVFTGLASAGAVIISLVFLDGDNKIAALAVITSVLVFQAVGMSTLTVLPLDMAPMFSGLITSISFSFAMLVSMSGPLIVSAVAPNNTFEEWRMVWILMSIFLVSAAIVFGIFGQASLQPWAEGKREAVPHIVLPFVNMGRRFSSIHETMPTSPVSPSKKFEFTHNAQLAIMLPAMSEIGDVMQIADQLRFDLDRSPSIKATESPALATGSNGKNCSDGQLAGVDNNEFQPEQTCNIFVVSESQDKRKSSETKEFTTDMSSLDANDLEKSQVSEITVEEISSNSVEEPSNALKENSIEK